MVAGRQARHLRALDAGVGARVRARRHGDQRAPAIRPARRARVVAVQRVVRELVALSRQPRGSPPPIGVRRSPVRRIRGRLGSRARRVGSRRVGGALRRDRRAVCRPRHQASRRVLPLADRRAQPASVRLGVSPRRRRRARRSRAGGRSALRPLLLGGSRLDLRRPADGLAGRHARGDSSRRLPGLCRCPGPRTDRAVPTERPLERHRVAGGRKTSVVAVRALLRTGTGRCRQRSLDAVESAARRDPPHPGTARDRCRRAPASATRLRHRPTEASALRRAHARVRRLPGRAAHPVGVRAGHGSQLRLQRAVAT